MFSLKPNSKEIVGYEIQGLVHMLPVILGLKKQKRLYS